ncbi:GlxA family transcriptional regulator [Endozoicomonas sp. G2_2]|uniref:GlxA family transcriptional regulator n=1 Tax=Endozoicomonas sp. G2_2 TaxID=2821092 RepID=UPI001AD96C38|nr:GlxA family transcriptional regulator [Endozoicomonas sp. G2_2]MBO9471638.1 GlxA family transcriptional regulator [Endozoicomonas sp. G2_2]
MPHQVGFFIYPRYQILDLAGAMSVFQTAGALSADAVYQQRVVSAVGGQIENSAGLAVESDRLRFDTFFDTFIVVGGGNTDVVTRPDQQLIRRICEKSHRVASVCTGAFILAASGLLDGRRATTHWARVAELRRRYPRISVEPDPIFIRDGQIWTSAGITSGIDMALAMVAEDHGDDLARDIARELVVYYRRPGGQSQFSGMAELTPESERIQRVLDHIRTHLQLPLKAPDLAAVANLSPRQFARVFRRETGETPAKAVERLRAEAARQRIEKHDRPIEQVAIDIGFGDSERMRRAFIRWYGLSPQTIRRAARTHTKPR